MSHFSTLDLVVFGLYISFLIGIGAWFTRRETGLKEYLLADQNVHWVVVGISVLAALFSGITYLGAPAESFFNNLVIIWTVLSFLIATPIATIVFLPFFRQLGIYTAYEYLEKRFDRRLKWMASALFILRGSCYLGLAISAPAIVVSEMTGWSYVTCALISGVAATLYTTLGGMKAVIWTDSAQFIVLCGGIVVIIYYSLAGVPDGIAGVLRLAEADGKTKWFDFSLDPRIRVTVWSGLIGGLCNNLVQLVTDQISVQRYLTARSLGEARRALWLKMGLSLPLVGAFYLAGTVMYGYYAANPDRIPQFVNAAQVSGLPESTLTNVPLKNDRLLPYFVTHELPSPLPGLLIAAIVGATMAVISAGINALATAALVDFSRGGVEDETGKVRLARILTLVFGSIATVLALVVAMLGTLIEATNTIMGLFGGPLLGVFLLGVLTRRASGSAALFGAAMGALAGVAVKFGGDAMKLGISFLWITPSAVLATLIFGWLAGRVLKPARDVDAFVYSWKRRPVES